MAATASTTGTVRSKEFHFPLTVEWIGGRRVAAQPPGNERAGLAYTSLRVNADGVAGKRADGHFGFTRLGLRLELETDPADLERARELARKAETNCLVSASLDLPVETVIKVKPRQLT